MRLFLDVSVFRFILFSVHVMSVSLSLCNTGSVDPSLRLVQAAPVSLFGPAVPKAKTCCTIQTCPGLFFSFHVLYLFFCVVLGVNGELKVWAGVCSCVSIHFVSSVGFCVSIHLCVDLCFNKLYFCKPPLPFQSMNVCDLFTILLLYFHAWDVPGVPVKSLGWCCLGQISPNATVSSPTYKD